MQFNLMKTDSGAGLLHKSRTQAFEWTQRQVIIRTVLCWAL